MSDDAPTDELALSARLQRAARESGDDNALAYASRRRWCALIAADPAVAARGYAIVPWSGETIRRSIRVELIVGPHPYRRTA